MKRLTTQEFIAKAKQTHGDKYDYSVTNYRSARIKVNIICSIHGSFTQGPHNHLNGSGCPACTNHGLCDQNRLSIQNKSLSLEWDYVKNTKSPEYFSVGSQKRAWWICKKCSYSWSAGIKDRNAGNGCPQCAGKIVTEYNNLAIINPEIAIEWDYNKNYPLRPENIHFSSNKKYYWICPKCSLSYKSQCSNRTNRNSNCPKCNESKGEFRIRKWLDDSSIKYISQYTDTRCKNKGLLKFDFAIWVDGKLGLIEYNGEQHYKVRGIFTEDMVKTIQKRDSIKVLFCVKNKIPLLTIPYTEINNIETHLESLKIFLTTLDNLNN